MCVGLFHFISTKTAYIHKSSILHGSNTLHTKKHTHILLTNVPF